MLLSFPCLSRTTTKRYERVFDRLPKASCTSACTQKHGARHTIEQLCRCYSTTPSTPSSTRPSSDASEVPRSKIRPWNIREVKVKMLRPNRTENVKISQDDSPINTVIGSFGDLQYESAINASPTDGRKRMVDFEQYRHSKPLWAQLLEFRQRLDGPAGVKDIWRGMRERNVDLPTMGKHTKHADFMWKAFLSAGFQDDGLLDEICGYAQSLYLRRGISWPHLLPVIVKNALRNDPSKAYIWYFRLRKIQPEGSSNLEKLLPEALTSKRSLKYFKDIYHNMGNQRLYKHMVFALCKRDRVSEALAWHRLMLSKGDAPWTYRDTAPLDRALEKRGWFHQQSELEDRLKNAGITLKRPADSAEHVDAVPQQESENEDQRIITAESVSKAAPRDTERIRKPIFDHLVARWFATTYLTLDALIIGLGMSRVRTLGAQSMRELGARCSSALDFSRRLEQLRLNGIQVDGSIFSQLLKKLASDRKDALFHAAIRNDAHADVYEDKDVQSRLLSLDIHRKDWHMAHVRLITLVTFHNDLLVGGWNTVLQGLIKERKWLLVHQVLENMLLTGISVSGSTIKMSFFNILPAREPGKRPPTLTEDPDFDDLHYLTKMWLKIFDHGGHIPAKAWNQVHNYYGMTGRLGEMEKLSLWLAVLYSRDPTSMAFKRLTAKGLHRSLSFHSRARGRNAGCPPGLSYIFRRPRQAAMIEWAFKTLGSPIPNEDKPQAFAGSHDYLAVACNIPHRSEHWTRGVALLRVLRRYGVPVLAATIRKTCRLRLRILFGPGQSENPSNRMAVRRNRHTLGQMVRILNRVWGENIFGVPTRVLQDETALRYHVLGARWMTKPRRHRRGMHVLGKT